MGEIEAANRAWDEGHRKGELSEQCTITRVALEGLVDQVPGMSVDWNNGNPIFTQHGDRLGLSSNGETTIGKPLRLSPGALSRGGAGQLDAVARGIARREAKAEDDAIKAKLKAKGASDADIAAAEKLLGLPLPTPPYKVPPQSVFISQLDKNLRQISGLTGLAKTPPYVNIRPTDIP